MPGLEGSCAGARLHAGKSSRR